MYMTNGWYDLFTSDMFLWYANLTVPRRLVVRPLDHSQVEDDGADLDFGAEVHRWFDYWLKGIENGIMEEPSIAYAYALDYSTTSGGHSRWGAVLVASEYPNMRDNDEKALTYTTLPRETDVEVTGHPVMHLKLVTDAPDLDVFVYLEEVDGQGNAAYITEGNLRASHRGLSAAPYDNLGLPHHRHYESDLEPLPAGEPFELSFELPMVSVLTQNDDGQTDWRF